MNKKILPIRFKDKFTYGFISFVANFGASILGIGIPRLLIKAYISLFGNMSQKTMNIFGYLTIFPLTFILSWVFVIFLTKKFMPVHFDFCDDENGYTSHFVRLILPGEILRWLVVMFPLGSVNSTGYLSLLPSMLFENTYLKWSDRHKYVRQYLEFIPADYWAYSLCYLIYIAIYMAGLIAIYRYLASREDPED